MLAVDFDGLLVLASLDVKVGSLLPVVGVAFELGLLDQDLGIQVRLVTHLVFAVFTDELLSLSEFLEVREDFNSLIDHVSFDVVHGGFLEFTLVGQNLRLKPGLIKIVYVVHFFSCLAQVNVLKLTNVHKSFPCEVELLGKESLNTQCAPIRDCHTQAGELIRHVEVFLAQKAVEG